MRSVDQDVVAAVGLCLWRHREGPGGLCMGGEGMRRVVAACAAAFIVVCACLASLRDGSESRVFLEEHDSVSSLSSTLQSDGEKKDSALTSLHFPTHE